MNPTQGHRDYRQPPERKSMHARIVHDLGMRIVAGEFRPGDRLPVESRAADRLRRQPAGAARSHAGAGRQGPGAVAAARRCDRAAAQRVASARPRRAVLADPDQAAAEFVETLLTARRVFEPATAALAAKVASDADLHGIAEAYAGMEAARTPERAARARPGVSPPHRRGHPQRPAGLHRQHAVAGAARVDQAEQQAPEHPRAVAAAAQGDPDRAAATATRWPRTRPRWCN